MSSHDFKRYRRRNVAEARPWSPGDDMTRVSVSAADIDAGSPRPGDMIARNPKNHDDRWLIAAEYFRENFEPVELDDPQSEALRLRPDQEAR